MKTLWKNLANLFKVKTLITFCIIASLCYAFLKGNIPSELFAAIAGSVVTYYFTKAEDREKTE